MGKVRTKTKRPRAGRVDQIDDLPVVGWREWLAFPGLGVDRIKAKIDSGARTSAIHAFDLRTFHDGGSPCVSFVLHPRQHRRFPAVCCVAPISDERLVTSSNGLKQLRLVIRTDISLGDRTWPIEVTLADRDQMGFRLLLGREALRRRFLVDPSRSFLAGRSFADVSTISVDRPGKVRSRSKTPG